MSRFIPRFLRVLVLSLALLPIMAPAPGLAQAVLDGSICTGHGYTVVRGTDGTPFKNAGACLKYVKNGGVGAYMVIDVYYRAEEHCEFTVDLYGMTPGALIPVSIVHPEWGPRTLNALIGTDGSSWGNDNGGYGVGFSIPLKHTITVTATYTVLGSPAELTSTVRC